MADPHTAAAASSRTSSCVSFSPPDVPHVAIKLRLESMSVPASGWIGNVTASRTCYLRILAPWRAPAVSRVAKSQQRRGKFECALALSSGDVSSVPRGDDVGTSDRSAADGSVSNSSSNHIKDLLGAQKHQAGTESFPENKGSHSGPSLRYPNPRHLTFNICDSSSLARLDQLITQEGSFMNAIHVAAAIVKLANLHGNDANSHTLDSSSSSNRTNSSSGSSSSSRGSWGSGAAEATSPASTAAAAKPYANGLNSSSKDANRGVGLAEPFHLDSASDKPAAAAPSDLAPRLLAKLGAMYMDFCELGAYPGARQHANIAWAIGKCGLTPPPGLVDRLVGHLLEGGGRRLQSATPQELANLALGLAKVGYSEGAMWSMISASTASTARLSLFKPQELANLAWSCVAGPQLEEPGVRRLVAAIGEHAAAADGRLGCFKSQELASLLWATAKAGLPQQHRRPLFEAAARHYLRLLQQQGQGMQQGQQGQRRWQRLDKPLNSQDVANVLWAFAKVGHLDKELLDAMGDAVSSSISPTPPLQPLSSSSPGDSAASTAAAAAAQPGRVRASCARLDTFQPQELSIVLWAYATLRYNHEGVLRAAMQQLTNRSGQLSPQALANACWAAGRMLRLRLGGRPAGDGPMALGRNSSSGMEGGEAGAGQLRAEEPAALLKFARAMTAAAAGAAKSAFTVQELSNTLWGLTQIQLLQTSSFAKAWPQATGPSSPNFNLAGDASEPGSSGGGRDGAQETTGSPARGRTAGSPEQQYWQRSQQRQQQQHVQQKLQQMTQHQQMQQQQRQQEKRFREGIMPLVEAASRRVEGMEPRALAQVAWVGSKLDARHDGNRDGGSGSGAGLLTDAVCLAAMPRLHQFGAQDLATLVHSLAQGGESADWALFNAVGDAAVPLIQRQEFTSAGLANTVWAFARQRQRHDKLAEAVVASAYPRLREFGMVELANLLWGLYRLGQQDARLFDRAAAHIASGKVLHVVQSPYSSIAGSGSDGQQQERQLLLFPLPAASSTPAAASSTPAAASSTPAAAATAAPQPSMSHLPVARPAPRPSRMLGMGLSVLAWSFARCRYRDMRLYDVLAAMVLPHLPCIPSYNLTQLLWAFSAQDCRNVRLLDAAAAVYISRLARSEAVLASESAGYNKASLRPLDTSSRKARAGTETEAGVGAEAETQAEARVEAEEGIESGAEAEAEAEASSILFEQQQQQQKPATARGWLATGLHASDPRLDDSAENHEVIHPADISMIAWIYAKLGHYNAPLFSAVLDSAMATPPPPPPRGGGGSGRSAAPGSTPSGTAPSHGSGSSRGLNLRGWARLAWAFSTLGLPEEDMVVAQLQLRTRAEHWWDQHLASERQREAEAASAARWLAAGGRRGGEAEAEEGGGGAGGAWASRRLNGGVASSGDGGGLPPFSSAWSEYRNGGAKQVAEPGASVDVGGTVVGELPQRQDTASSAATPADAPRVDGPSNDMSWGNTAAGKVHSDTTATGNIRSGTTAAGRTSQRAVSPPARMDRYGNPRSSTAGAAILAARLPLAGAALPRKAAASTGVPADSPSAALKPSPVSEPGTTGADSAAGGQAGSVLPRLPQQQQPPQPPQQQQRSGRQERRAVRRRLHGSDSSSSDDDDFDFGSLVEDQAPIVASLMPRPARSAAEDATGHVEGQ